MSWRLISLILIPLALIIWESAQKKNPDAASEETDIPDSEKPDAPLGLTAKSQPTPESEPVPKALPQPVVAPPILMKQRGLVTKEGIHISPVTLSWLQQIILKLGESTLLQTGIVAKYGGEFEKILERRFGAQGKGLGEKINNVEEQLPPSLVRKLRDVAAVRGKFVHNPTYRFSNDKEMRAFFYLADDVRQGIEKCDKIRRYKR